jgi:hypothetical protein
VENAGAPETCDSASLGQRRWYVAAGFLSALALVGGMVFWKLSRRAAAGSLPAYRVASANGEAPLTWVVGAEVTLIVEPVTEVEGDVTAAAYWVNGSEAPRWNAKTSVTSKGVVEFAGKVDEQGGVDAELAIVITRENAAPTPAACQPPGCQLLRQRIQLVRGIVPTIP